MSHSSRSRFAAAAASVATGVVMFVAGATAVGTSVALLTSVASFGEPSRLVLVAKAPGVARPGSPGTTVAMAATAAAAARK